MEKTYSTQTHPFLRSCRHLLQESANLSVKEADLVIFIGSETGSMTTHFWAVPTTKVRVIQIDIEPENLGKKL